MVDAGPYQVTVTTRLRDRAVFRRTKELNGVIYKHPLWGLVRITGSNGFSLEMGPARNVMIARRTEKAVSLLFEYTSEPRTIYAGSAKLLAGSGGPADMQAIIDEAKRAYALFGWNLAFTD